MRNATHAAFAVLLTLLVPALCAANIVTYDSEPLYTVYDGSMYAPGDYLFTEDLADAYIAEFFISGTPYFNGARIEPASAIFGSGHILNLNNISVVIEFNAAGDATFEYLYYGGSVNLEVNGALPLEGPDMASLIGTVAPGVTLNVVETFVSGGVKGTATLTGPVQRLRVGGQEFYVDDMYCRNGIGAPADECDYLVDHETLAIGDTWGSATNLPGDWIFAEDGIDVTIHELTYGGGSTGFNFCRVVGAPVADFGSAHVMELNNVSNLYHIDSLGIPVEAVKFEYLDFGGTENLQVNGAMLHIGDLDTFPAAVAPGVTMTQIIYPLGGGGYRAEVTLYGEVKKLLVGGQEFYIDEICVIEGEPLECDYIVDHESLGLGDSWGAGPGHGPGDLAFVEDGIPVRLEVFDAGTGGYFNQCDVVPATAGMGDSLVMQMNNICNLYEINALGKWVAEVTFEFLSYGGIENLEVNGAGRFVGDIELAPATPAPGVAYTVTTTPVPGGVRGTGRLVGEVQELLLGGQEFLVDNICVKLHPASGADLPVQRGGLELKGNYPNPFNPQTTIRFALEREQHVRVTIHDAAGRLVKTLLSERMPAGEHPVVWTGRDDRDAAVAAGVYLVRVAAESGEVKTHKIGLVK